MLNFNNFSATRPILDLYTFVEYGSLRPNTLSLGQYPGVAPRSLEPAFKKISLRILCYFSVAFNLFRYILSIIQYFTHEENPRRHSQTLKIIFMTS